MQRPAVQQSWVLPPLLQAAGRPTVREKLYFLSSWAQLGSLAAQGQVDSLAAWQLDTTVGSSKAAEGSLASWHSLGKMGS